MFYLITVLNDSKEEIKKYNSFDEALAAYHTELANRGKSRKVTKCVILNSELLTVKHEVYTASGDTKE